MGYKIEIVLISIAVLICGSFIAVAAIYDSTPVEISENIVATEASSLKVEKININTADKSELEQLEGIGEKTAEKIIEYRRKNTFKKVSDIMNVDGIGQKKFLDIKKKIIVN